MDYFVIGSDGNEYGPASIDTLRSWVAESRVLPTTMLKNFQTGQTAAASTISELFPQPPPTQAAQPGSTPPGNWSQPPSGAAAYPRSAPAAKGGSGNTDIAMALVRSVAALIFFFVYQTFGIVFAIYGIIWAFRAKEKGHKLANVAIGVSIATAVVIGIGMALGLGGGSLKRP